MRVAPRLSLQVDPFGAAPSEVGCELELGDGSRIPIVIDVNTATAFGQARRDAGAKP